MKERHSIVCASYLLLFRVGKILLLRRCNTGYEDGKYSVPAGHVDKDESVANALVREAKEEIGVNIDKKDIQLTHIMHRRAGKTNEERIDFFFSCEKWNGKIKNMEPQKCDDLSWYSLDELPDNIVPYVRASIENSAGGLVYGDVGWKIK